MFTFVFLRLALLLAPSVLAIPAEIDGLGVAGGAKTNRDESGVALSEKDTIYDIKRSFGITYEPQKRSPSAPPPREDDLRTGPHDNSFLIPIANSDTPPAHPAVTEPAPGDDVIPIHWRKGPFSLDGTFDLDTLELDVILGVPGGKSFHIDCSVTKSCRFDIDYYFIRGYVELYIRYGNQLWLHIDLTVLRSHIVHDYYILTFKPKGNVVPAAPPPDV